MQRKKAKKRVPFLKKQKLGLSPSKALLRPQFLKLFTTSLVPVRMSGQAFIVIGPRIAANYGLQIQAFGVNLLNSLMKFMTVKGNASKNKEVLPLLFAECFSLV